MRVQFELHPSWKYRFVAAILLGIVIIPFATGHERVGYFLLGVPVLVLALYAVYDLIILILICRVLLRVIRALNQPPPGFRHY
ncbi:MAG: hypothetical protein A3J07_04525 [Candidatus Doudnabacteria bacterium RIFCSPLOWO2_02_FULL_49_13]|uniref:Cytochrome b/b6 C-terminal region profile domain-containing protein n=1 Tax=Candidatus Doudnabacteria bacterium RIFCSPHIGHO2_12_FULL_48_16 TaxID=1817838 RepID=A0A1F5PKH9_9BACT|nr:MAG: hypothetical protein A3B77_04390 [Candidatus Doudnabacteria bacterium RIFCSPHIGHO2_02_FULL_49_24]OGE90172.1 MAG: hypothetical protein A3E29_03660 [Candidatus Doudnabacteria bacterium RIFCSPHIGHO2_12_FULL_48_16]OGE97817.1 MAG: hypothetical protein A2990_04195 [Candidatus Doudnabacteria bacterium RIFCSPLOWO2_01_FULL_49_40]OGF03316.1 MAG: hypothetical protein A3J07_04525 [Candidatus Doudnabacteria bacterium RIFCSPLOWO2_02_FULL_49_13]OGF03474.1 MAG: hypothetical protein A3H14_04350 [Candida